MAAQLPVKDARSPGRSRSVSRIADSCIRSRSAATSDCDRPSAVAALLVKRDSPEAKIEANNTHSAGPRSGRAGPAPCPRLFFSSQYFENVVSMLLSSIQVFDRASMPARLSTLPTPPRSRKEHFWLPVQDWPEALDVGGLCRVLKSNTARS